MVRTNALRRTFVSVKGFYFQAEVVGQPVTWEKDGKQYVTVMSGIGGVYAQRSGDPNLVNLPTGVTLWTFELFDK